MNGSFLCGIPSITGSTYNGINGKIGILFGVGLDNASKSRADSVSSADLISVLIADTGTVGDWSGEYMKKKKMKIMLTTTKR